MYNGFGRYPHRLIKSFLSCILSTARWSNPTRWRPGAVDKLVVVTFVGFMFAIFSFFIIYGGLEDEGFLTEDEILGDLSRRNRLVKDYLNQKNLANPGQPAHVHGIQFPKQELQLPKQEVKKTDDVVEDIDDEEDEDYKDDGAPGMKMNDFLKLHEADILKHEREMAAPVLTAKPQLLSEEQVRQRIHVYNLSQPVAIVTDMQCQTLKILPHTDVCLYPNDVDKHVSAMIRSAGIWEPHIVKEIQNSLFNRPGAGLVDIGANIGMYSLVAAAMGRHVVAVEPRPESIYRIHKASVLRNSTGFLTVVQNALSDAHRRSWLYVPNDNQGGAALDGAPAKSTCILGDPSCSTSVDTLVMDDLLLLNLPFKSAVLKIDIEGHEHRAFMHSARFLERIYIPLIFMEWLKLRSYYGSKVTNTEDKNMTFDLIDRLQSRGYTPYSIVTGEELKRDFWFGWPDDIFWRHRMEDIL